METRDPEGLRAVLHEALWAAFHESSVLHPVEDEVEEIIDVLEPALRKWKADHTLDPPRDPDA